MRQHPFFLRMARISGFLVLLLYVWSSSGALVAKTREYYDMEAQGKVLRIDSSKLLSNNAKPQQQQRQMWSSNPTTTTYSLQQQQEQLKQQQRLMDDENDEDRDDDDGYSLSRNDQKADLQQLLAKNNSNKPLQNKPQSPQPATNTTTTSTTTTSSECGLYLAPSTIPGAGLGMFSARPLLEGEYVGEGEVVIPLIELPFYNGIKSNVFNPFINYYWKGQEKALHGLVAEHRTGEVQAVVPGFDSAINCHLALINVDMSSTEYDDGNLHRYTHPMSGAMTPYHSTASRVIREIPAGGELFKFYGDRWFAARAEQFGKIPLSEDYPAAETLIKKFDKLSQEYFPDSVNLQADLLSLMKDTIGGQDMWQSRVMLALPDNPQDAHKAAVSGIASLYQPQAIRSVEYLRQHGKCVDNIRPGPSTLPSLQGGRGAFATRDLPEGTIITGSPLHHLPQKDILTIYRMERNGTDSTTGDEVWLRHVDDVVGHQLILNYCYGHPESTMLLCPYGSGISYINHNQTLANVKIQWAQHGMTSHDDTWLYKRRPEELEWDYGVGLAFDYVATKDIREGEELFLDYGYEFEKALQEHMSKWKPPKGNSSSSSSFHDSYMSAEVYNKQVATAPLRTDKEQRLEPYPDNLEMHCHQVVLLNRNNASYDWESRDVGYPCRILKRYKSSQQEGVSEQEISRGTVAAESVYKVEVRIPLDEVGFQYKVDTYNYVQRRDVPRNAIRFFNKPYTTDLFLRTSFRKEIGIPDSMFPGQWRNAPKTLVEFTQPTI